jgi:hypothetical protein
MSASATAFDPATASSQRDLDCTPIRSKWSTLIDNWQSANGTLAPSRHRLTGGFASGTKLNWQPRALTPYKAS